MTYKVAVLAFGETTWASNGRRFTTFDEAARYGEDLANRWLGVKEWRVEEVEG